MSANKVVENAIELKKREIYLNKLQALYPIPEEDSEYTEEYKNACKMIHMTWRKVSREASQAFRHVMRMVDTGELKLAGRVRELYLQNWKIEIDNPQEAFLEFMK